MSEVTGNEYGVSMPKVPCEACDSTGKVTERRKANGRIHLITRSCALCDGTGQRTAGQ